MKGDERVLDSTTAFGARGGSRYFMNGRLMTGPDYLRGLGSLAMILIPSVLLDVFVIPGFDPVGSLITYLVLIPVQLLSMGLLLGTIYSNPGVLPRQRPYTEHYDFLNREYRSRAPEKFQDFIINCEPVRMKFCGTCGIYRPPRCSHCSVCDNCVDKFDHHCPWVGNCIGRQNYQRFFFFVLFTALLTLGSMAVCISLLIVETNVNDDGSRTKGEAFLKTLREYPLSMAILIYCTLLSWFTVGLGGYHTFLVMKGISTNEQIKGHLDKHNPYSSGPVRNLLALLKFRPMDKAFFNGNQLGSLPPLRKAFREVPADNPEPISLSKLSIN